MNRIAYVVGHFSKAGYLVDVGVYSEPFPTVVDDRKGRPQVLAAVHGTSYGSAQERAQPTVNFLRKMMTAAPAQPRNT